MTSENIKLIAGDKDSSNSYIVIMLSREELKDIAQKQDMDIPTTDVGWRYLAQKVGSAMWDNWTIGEY